jgi:hypothetical protein
LGKITLVTPPDYFENSNISILLVGFSQKDQEDTSVWLKENDQTLDINFYYYQGEDTIEWLLYALARADYTYINCESDSLIIQKLLTYMVSRPGVFWSSQSEDTVKILTCLSNKQVNTIEDFLKGIFSE